ncbi:MAG: ADP-ribose pyrophosphatase, partial [Globicatella sulfidifaciens]|nr:ADP-ribose pyrophosphatase [Globicatella sulfidifaciens]
TKADIRQMMSQGKIVDVKTLYALQYWLAQ